MKHIDEYRDPALVRALARRLAEVATRPWTVMEVCGGQTHAIVRWGLDRLLPPGLELVHGPGCPVCVTPAAVIDQAIAIAHAPGAALCTFGDMLRVPGAQGDLQRARAAGADVRVVYGPDEALELARREPDLRVVFLAVGFETTAPAVALAVHRARVEGVANFAVLAAHVLVPPAIEAILAAPGNRVQGFLAAGHVCAVMGWRAYEPIAARRRVPIVVTGFEPVDLLQGLLMCVEQLEAGRHAVENQYARSVERAGNVPAQELIAHVFRVVDRPWRGIGELGASGLALAADYAAHDAARIFGLASAAEPADARCRAGEVLTGRLRPDRCGAFGTACTPETPLGAPMVSGEGACAAYMRYRARGAGMA